MNSSFIKWAGGKRWFVSKYNYLLPDDYNTYIEPFLGGGAVFFYLEPEKAILNDINGELIITYKTIKKSPKELINKLKMHSNMHNKEYYYKIRSKEYKNDIDIAARMIYLNRTCFNGIYRVNPSGNFNVPIGSYNSVIREDDNFEKRSKLLKNAKLTNYDFEKVIEMAKKDDFIFCDPPYAIEENNHFVSYTKNLFSYNDQKRLAGALARAKKRGVKILMTNVNHKSIKRIFPKRDGYKWVEVERKCNISGINQGRKIFNELIVTANI